MQKKEYKTPKMKEVKLKARTSLLQASSGLNGTLGYDADAVENTKA